MSFFSNITKQLSKEPAIKIYTLHSQERNKLKDHAAFMTLMISLFFTNTTTVSTAYAEPASQVVKEAKQTKKLETSVEKTADKTECKKQVNPQLPTKQKVLNVTGMVCAFCVQGIEIHLKKLSGIKEVSVDLDQGKVLLNIEQSNSPSSEELCEAIKRAGYTVTTIEFAP